jgi:glycogen debranching enzyme
MLRFKLIVACALTTVVICSAMTRSTGRPTLSSVAKATLPATGLLLERPTYSGRFFDAIGRRAAVFGYEHRGFEAWVYPVKILEDFRLLFTLRGYPLEIPAEDILATITTRPEATTFTYSHAAFTVRQIIFVPIDQPAIIMLMDVQTTLPIRITAAFRPRLRLMWPAGLMTPNISWSETEHIYTVTEESRRFAGAIGSPAAQDLALMPYQEEPRDVPVRFAIDASPEEAADHFIPIVIAGSVKGADEANALCRKLLATGGLDLHAAATDHYRQVLEHTTRVTTPVERLDTAYAWAKIGIDKGLATNPFLGTGLVAGFRTSGDSERPGFAWFFGRDALWTLLASSSLGDFQTVRTGLEFLKKFQRADGKIPHEISQSASLIPWFSDYQYPWASADATPLYVIAHADYWRARGDLEFLKASWDSIIKAYKFTAATDTDGNGLIENTGVGHGWVEGGALYPPHEEIYMQGLWVAALNGLAEIAEVMQDPSLASAARTSVDRVKDAVERTYWLEDRGFYAFATAQPRSTPAVAEPGPNRERRQKRLDALGTTRLIDEDTVLPAVPLWWRTLDDRRAQQEIDRLGGGALATDWGTRLLSARSELYDPLSYHYGSVWPLFTGWAAVAAYEYGRPSVAYQALTANALLTYSGALGYVTELLSGDFNSPFGRSSHHQIWSEAMVVAPLLRGLFGLRAMEAGTVLRFEPHLPADWDRVSATNVAVGENRYDVMLERRNGLMTIKIGRRAMPSAETTAAPGLKQLIVAPAFPLDAIVRSVRANGRPARFEITRRGDVQQARVVLDAPSPQTDVTFSYVEGSDVYTQPEVPAAGSENVGLRILRSTAARDQLKLVVEGRGRRSYTVFVRTPHRIGNAPGVTLKGRRGTDWEMEVAFDGPEGDYVRREIVLPFMAR